MNGHHLFSQIVFLSFFPVKVTWYEAHYFNHMWLYGPATLSTTWLCNSHHHLSPRFLTFHLNWNSVPVKHHLPVPLPPPYPASPGINQCNSTKSFYFPFPPKSLFAFLLWREHDAFYLLWQVESKWTPSLRRTLVRQEGTRNLGGPRAHTLEAGAIARRLTSERLKPGGLGSNPRSSAEQLGNPGKVIYLSSSCVGWI